MAKPEMIVYPPDECARRLGGISVDTLVALLKANGYGYTDLRPGGGRWGEGRQTWGMTDEQIGMVIAGQARHHESPASAAPLPAPRGIPGHDGKSRLRKAPRKAG